MYNIFSEAIIFFFESFLLNTIQTVFVCSGESLNGLETWKHSFHLKGNVLPFWPFCRGRVSAYHT